MSLVVFPDLPDIDCTGRADFHPSGFYGHFGSGDWCGASGALICGMTAILTL